MIAPAYMRNRFEFDKVDRRFVVGDGELLLEQEHSDR